MTIFLFVAFAACVVGANWALVTFGLVPIGFGLMAPAGVYFAGISFTVRDLLHRAAGRRVTVIAVAMGAALSMFLGAGAPRIAVASGIAFLLSELADLAVYEPLERRGWLRAVAVSNAVGFTVDSALFLWMAFGSVDFITGQLLGKGYMTVLAIAGLWGWRAISQRRN
jgi:uncharacterized PurR-regulated membrane protein YhhQ (DUF165 family)